MSATLPEGSLDLAHQRHLSRQIRENYDFMVETGSSHEAALRRLDLTEAQWQKVAEADRKRQYWRDHYRATISPP